jgi:hypothetical protein
MDARQVLHMGPSPTARLWHTFSALMQVFPQGMPFVHDFGALVLSTVR